MKRYFVLIILLAVFLGVMLHFAPKPFKSQIKNFSADSQVVVYCRNTDLPAQNLGNGFLVRCDVSNLNKTLASCKNVDGISVSFCGNQQDVQALLQKWNVSVCSLVELENLQVICGHSNKICGGIWLDGKTVNLQIAFDGKIITVGNPLILNGY